MDVVAGVVVLVGVVEVVVGGLQGYLSLSGNYFFFSLSLCVRWSFNTIGNLMFRCNCVLTTTVFLLDFRNSFTLSVWPST